MRKTVIAITELIILKQMIRDEEKSTLDLLIEHKEDLLTSPETKYYIKNSSVVPSSQKDDYVMMITEAKNKDCWTRYNESVRNEKRAWFKTFLIDSGRIQVVQAYEYEMEIGSPFN